MARRGFHRLTAALLSAALLIAGCTSTSRTAAYQTLPGTAQGTISTAGGPVRTTSTASAPARTTSTANAPSRTTSTANAPASSSAQVVARHGLPLPLPFGTADATQVITAVAPSPASTEGALQAWRRVPGGWRRVGSPAHAWFGSDGLTRRPSETRSATPIGSFTLTRAFGRNPDPGTALPYTRTTPGDWWISEPGPLYNTLQRCLAQCGFAQGDPNEHLYYAVPYYRYAVVIDYNTVNSPTGVVPGAGSAFFLHVTVKAPTQGCISIAQERLVSMLRWLSPARHPRILIGTS